MEDSAKIGTCVEHSRNNKYFVEFVEHQEKLKAKNPAAYEGVNLEDDGAFLAYMTRKYFKDNMLASILKIIIGIALLVTAKIILLGPYHFCPLSSPFLHEMFPWYL